VIFPYKYIHTYIYIIAPIGSSLFFFILP
jgi:hypothetical protein